MTCPNQCEDPVTDQVAVSYNNLGAATSSPTSPLPCLVGDLSPKKRRLDEAPQAGCPPRGGRGASR